ncbi:MAG: outer membrane beta-barrel protein [Syntrophus sp. (in: bacteria)]
MKKKVLCYLVIGLFILSASSAIAQDVQSSGRPQWSVGIQGGMVFPSQYTLDDKVPPYGQLSDMKANNSLLLGVKAGWTPNLLQQYFTTQLEYFHVFGPNADNQVVGSQSGETGSLQFNTTIDAIFVNFILRYPNGRWHPFVGIGPGWAWVKLSNAQATLTDGTQDSTVSDRYSQSDNKFAWQAFVGLEYDIMRSWSADLSYRYYAVNTTTYGDQLGLNARGQSVNLGINFKF